MPPASTIAERFRGFLPVVVDLETGGFNAKTDALLEIAAVNEWVANKPPRTFREACQWMLWYQMAGKMYNMGGALGRVDQLLYPYYAHRSFVVNA